MGRRADTANATRGKYSLPVGGLSGNAEGQRDTIIGERAQRLLAEHGGDSLRAHARAAAEAFLAGPAPFNPTGHTRAPSEAPARQAPRPRSRSSRQARQPGRKRRR